MIQKDVTFFGKPVLLACDANCDKAWGISNRPHVQLSADADDIAYLADGELGEAPADPGTYEGAHGKPTLRPMTGEAMNKWCARECERCIHLDSVSRHEPIVLPNYSKRHYNMPWRHRESVQGAPAPSPESP